MDISTGHMVLSYMEGHLKNKDKLEQEWLALCAYEADPCSTTVAEKSENLKKNRDKTAVPYDHARVILNDLSNISGSDYINASTITDHDPRNPAYIACQGPMAGTSADFWQMVWEQGSVVIVMLTKLAENGTAMCHRYWPEEGSEVYHIYEVHLVSEHIWCEDYLVRSFYLKNLKTGETRTVTQFHFLSWPVDGVPSSTRALLEFRRKVNKSYRGRSCPIIVHCNDGSGRTGTYCLIDMVLNRMAKGAKEIDIAATLEHIRDQRPGTVKTRAQFEFVLMAVAEEVHAILKAMPQ
jgi:receptor-type tyrosine-protein phosphatase N